MPEEEVCAQLVLRILTQRFKRTDEIRCLLTHCNKRGHFQQGRHPAAESAIDLVLYNSIILIQDILLPHQRPGPNRSPVTLQVYTPID